MGTVNYGIDSSFWLKLLFILVLVGVLLYSFNAIMRRVLKVEKRKLFSLDHVNSLHKKMDWTIRMTFIVLLIFGGIINILRQPEPILILQPYILMIMLVFLPY
ncbi:hypothetical protein JNUCC1_02607 [Lentibacillus sp. JNUCC-1]|uniref:DUF4181 domain-containing protein n=1 Tax=Lentibacillus sp. JNUCC-1 TaxID=2654513 RepID=UPI0012E79A51|nr:DUF4181 domain-containing protein [Lentibacillus sp. JNUCC-1]MUV38736.1 hypothetical protein [Lentibacillus sp. JNUCC-1]